MDIQQRLTSFAMMGATWVMWLLIGLSVGGLAVALERAIYLIRTSDNIRRLKAEILRLLRAGDLDAARARLAQSRSVEAQVVAAGLEQDEGSAAAEERMGGAAQIAKLRMEKRLAFLSLFQQVIKGRLGSADAFGKEVLAVLKADEGSMLTRDRAMS